MKNTIFALLLIITPLSAQSEQVFNFGVVPQQSASKLASLWNPILKHISQQSGVAIRFATAPDIPTFEKRLAAGEYDFAYMNPYHYTVFHKSPGYQAISKARDKRIKGIIVSAKKNNYSTLKELDKSTIAFPAPAAFAATILTQSDLAKSKVDFTPKYVSSHDSVYRAVAKGIYPAGGGVIRTFKNITPDIRDQLKMLWTTKGYTPHAIATHPRVSLSDRAKVQQAIVSMEQSEDGKNLLYNIKIKGFEKASDNDWDDIRNLQIKRLPEQ